MPIRIAIVSCRPLVRGLISEWLRAKAETEIVVEATTMEPEIIAKCSEANLLILDASDCFAFSAVASVRSLVPSIRVLIISSGQGDYVLHRASLVGATGVIHEADTLDVFSAALSAVTGGGVYHSAGVMQRRGTMPLMKALTTRELLVLENACWGTSDDETAKVLGCASATVETHRRNLMRKIGATDWAELIVLGIQLGVVDADRIKIGNRRRRSSMRRKTPKGH